MNPVGLAVDTADRAADKAVDYYMYPGPLLAPWNQMMCVSPDALGFHLVVLGLTVILLVGFMTCTRFLMGRRVFWDGAVGGVLLGGGMTGVAVMILHGDEAMVAMALIASLTSMLFVLVCLLEVLMGIYRVAMIHVFKAQSHPEDIGVALLEQLNKADSDVDAEQLGNFVIGLV